MVERKLSDASIEAGQVLLDRLDEYGLRPESAAWLFAHGLGDWKYVIATSAIDLVGRRKIYAGLLDVLDASDFGDVLTEADIQLVSPREPWYSYLRGTMHVGGRTRVTVKNSAFNGMKIDGVIYRFFDAPTDGELKRMVATFTKTAKKALALHGR